MPPVTVTEYDPAWPAHFQEISRKLKHYLVRCDVKFISIEHVGSTAIPGLAAKPNIDIFIEVPDAYNAERAKQALTHEPPAEAHYKCIGDGGIRGRISMKLHNREAVPDQSIYILNREDPIGRLVMRCYRTVRDTLRMPQHEPLKIAYGQIKTELAVSARDGVEYGKKKNPIIRKILQAAGWSDADIDTKESLDYRVSGEDDLPY